jgi:hypothetical protein
MPKIPATFLWRIIGSLAMACLAACWIAHDVPAQAGPTDQPPDVTEFVGRRPCCKDWARKAADSKNAARIDSAMRSLRCSEIGQDERTLRELYADNPDVLAALDATKLICVVRLPTIVDPQNPSVVRFGPPVDPCESAGSAPGVSARDDSRPTSGLALPNCRPAR